MMKAIVLSDAKSNSILQSEHGFSMYIESDDRKILFDTGASDKFSENAKALGIDLDTIDLVVLSHGHYDHGGGLEFLNRKILVCHPDCFMDRYRKGGYKSIGIDLTKYEIQERFDLQLHREPYSISENIIFLGEVPRVTDFEAKSTPYIIAGGAEDPITDDSGLVIVTKTGLVIFSGCAHSGICNMILHAQAVTGMREVRAVIGGFHLKRRDNQTYDTIRFLKGSNVQQVLPAHCTMEPALSLFHQEFGKNEVLVGQEWVFDS